MFSFFLKNQTLVPTHPVGWPGPSIASASGHRFLSPLPKRRQTRPTQPVLTKYLIFHLNWNLKWKP